MSRNSNGYDKATRFFIDNPDTGTRCWLTHTGRRMNSCVERQEGVLVDPGILYTNAHKYPTVISGYWSSYNRTKIVFVASHNHRNKVLEDTLCYR